MKGSIIKGLLGCGSVTGLGCSLGIPLSAGTKQQMNMESQSLGGGSRLVGVSLDTNEFSPQNLGLDFQDLGGKILGNLKKSDSQLSFPVESELKDILDSSPRYQILNEKYKSCDSTTLGKMTYCGFYELESNDKSSRYKLQLSYETAYSRGEKGSGRVNVIRHDGRDDKVKHGNSSQYSSSLGLEIENSKFENFLPFDQEASDGGHVLTGVSISKKEV